MEPDVRFTGIPEVSMPADSLLLPHNQIFTIFGDPTVYIQNNVVPIPTLGGITSLGVTSPLQSSTTNPILTNGTISIANSGVVANTYGDGTTVPQLSVNALGMLTSVINTPISFPAITGGNFVDSNTFIVGSGTATKRLGFEIDGSSPNTTLTLTTQQTTSQVLNVPNIAATQTLVCEDHAATLTNKNITSSSNTVYANALKSATTTVVVDASTAPKPNQTLVSSSSTAASWKTFPYLTRAAVYPCDGGSFVSQGIGIYPVGSYLIPNVSSTNNYTNTRSSEFYVNATISFAGFHTDYNKMGYCIGTSTNIGGFIFKARVAIASISASTRAFFGLGADAIGSILTTPFASAVNMIGVGFESASTSNYQVIYGGASGITQVDTGIPYGNGDKYIDIEMSIEGGSTVLYYSVTNCDSLAVFSGSFTGVLGTTLPGSSIYISPMCIVRTLVSTTTRGRMSNFSIQTSNQ